jgi:hypothetical protein
MCQQQKNKKEGCCATDVLWMDGWMDGWMDERKTRQEEEEKLCHR